MESSWMRGLRGCIKYIFIWQRLFFKLRLLFLVFRGSRWRLVEFFNQCWCLAHFMTCAPWWRLTAWTNGVRVPLSVTSTLGSPADCSPRLLCPSADGTEDCTISNVIKCYISSEMKPRKFQCLYSSLRLCRRRILTSLSLSVFWKMRISKCLFTGLPKEEHSERFLKGSRGCISSAWCA